MEVIRLRKDAWLKLLTLDDAEAMFALTDANRAYLRQWLPWLDLVRCVEDTRMFIKSTLEQARRNQGFHYGIWFRGRLAGTLGVHGIQWQNRRTSIGYWLGEAFQGNGLMTSAVRAYLDQLVFGAWNLNRVEIAAATMNWKSRAIPERLGFRLEGILRQNEYLYDHYVDHAVYGLLAEDWRNRLDCRPVQD